MSTELHPLPPFLPKDARILMSGSFPPPRARWCMEWFYPNFQNDMWRIWGYIATGDKQHFVTPDGKAFDKDKIVDFCTKTGIALSDTGEEAVRLKNNASDKYLQMVKPRDFAKLLEQLPLCRDVVLTGEKAVETLGQQWGFGAIAVGEYVWATIGGRQVRVWRMPSSSRAYPRPVEWKAAYYRRVLDTAMLDADK